MTDRTEADVIDPDNYDLGLQLIGRSFTLDADHGEFTLRVLRTNWDSLTSGQNALRARVFSSFDNGRTWASRGGFTIPGGELVNPRTGAIETENTFVSDVSGERGGTARLMRVEFDILQDQVPLSCSVDLRDVPQ